MKDNSVTKTEQLLIKNRVDSPLVSVIIPVFNVEKYLEECINSILYQPLTDIEILCINDGSTDSSCLFSRPPGGWTSLRRRGPQCP